MLDRSAVTEELRARVRAELPEAEEIGDPELRAKVIEAWALALAASSFRAIAEIEPSGNPGVNTLKRGTQTAHIRGVTRLAMRIADEMSALMPGLKIDRDILIAGALFTTSASPGSSIRRTAGAGRPIRARPGCPRCATRRTACTCASRSGCPRRWRTAQRRTQAKASSWSARSRTRSCTTPTTRSGRCAAPAIS
jgi:hypothetical protein